MTGSNGIMMKDDGLTFKLGDTSTTLSGIKQVRWTVFAINGRLFIYGQSGSVAALGDVVCCLGFAPICYHCPACRGHAAHFSHALAGDNSCLFPHTQAVMDAGDSREATNIDATDNVPTLKDAFDSSIVTVRYDLSIP